MQARAAQTHWKEAIYVYRCHNYGRHAVQAFPVCERWKAGAEPGNEAIVYSTSCEGSVTNQTGYWISVCGSTVLSIKGTIGKKKTKCHQKLVTVQTYCVYVNVNPNLQMVEVRCTKNMLQPRTILSIWPALSSSCMNEK